MSRSEKRRKYSDISDIITNGNMSDEDWDAVDTYSYNDSYESSERHNPNYFATHIKYSKRNEETWKKDEESSTKFGQYKSHSYSNKSDLRGHRKHSKNEGIYKKEKNSYYHQRTDKQTNSKKIEIDNSKKGQLIGSKGSNIKNIESEFHVRIKIEQNWNYNNKTDVVISGNSFKDIDNAIECIESQLNSQSHKHYHKGAHFSYTSSHDKKFNNTRNYESDWKNENPHRRDSNWGGQAPVDVDTCNQQPACIDWDAVYKIAEEAQREKWAKCPKMIKNFYKEDPEVANCNALQVQKLRDNNMKITVSRLFLDESNQSVREPIPNPIWKFEQCFSQYEDIMEELRKQGFKKPSPIQMQAWPILLKGEDLIGIAQTGTGKTLAFLLPAFIHTEYQPIPRNQRDGPNVLIMAPTRELALQIEKEVAKYSFRGMKSVCVYGGGNRKEQINLITKGTEIIIATPGRLNDLIQMGIINVNSITYLVLDEADRMLDMGFEPQIRKILLDIRPDRQTIMTSATWPPGVRRLAQQYANNPIQVCVGTLDLAAAKTVTQIIEMVDEEEKFDRLIDFLRKMEHHDKAIVFCGKKARADSISADLTLKHFYVQCIHGSRDQIDREQAIADISSGEVKILIATDVASRGLDIEDITHVINYDFPNKNIEEYVHRIGRTGRAGRTGQSISFLTREDWASAKELIPILEEADQEVPHGLREMAQRYEAMRQKRAKETNSFRSRRDRHSGRGGGSVF